MNWPDKKYKVVYADPPWFYYGSKTKNAAAGKHYDLMSQEELAELPVKDLMEDKAALLLWATGPRLHYAIRMIEYWDLYYRGVAFVWVKTRKDGGIIHGQGVPPTFTKPITEFVLLATTMKRGRPFELHDLAHPQVLLEPRGKHSEKPEAFRKAIDVIAGDVSKIELFAREQAIGWDVWGNEI